jgi:hypothetical protein
MAQSGPSDYRTPAREAGREEQSDGIMDQVGDAARDMGERAGTIAGELGAAGLAFAVGAVWKLGRRPEASTLDRLMAQLPELPDRRSLERWWQR